MVWDHSDHDRSNELIYHDPSGLGSPILVNPYHPKVNPPQVTPVSAETVHRPNTTTSYPQVQLSLESSHTQATSDCKESNLIQVVPSSSFQQISGKYGAGIRDAVEEPGFPGVGWHMNWEVWDFFAASVAHSSEDLHFADLSFSHWVASTTAVGAFIMFILMKF